MDPSATSITLISPRLKPPAVTTIEIAPTTKPTPDMIYGMNWIWFKTCTT